MEPLIGYLLLAEKLYLTKSNFFTRAWNFGPSKRQNMEVIELVKKFKEKMVSKSKILIKRKVKNFIIKKLIFLNQAI